MRAAQLSEPEGVARQRANVLSLVGRRAREMNLSAGQKQRGERREGRRRYPPLACGRDVKLARTYRWLLDTVARGRDVALAPSGLRTFRAVRPNQGGIKK